MHVPTPRAFAEFGRVRAFQRPFCGAGPPWWQGIPIGYRRADRALSPMKLHGDNFKTIRGILAGSAGECAPKALRSLCPCCNGM